MKKGVKIGLSVVGIAFLIVFVAGTLLYANRQTIFLSLAEMKVIEYAEVFCKSSEINTKLIEIAPMVTSKWDLLNEEDKIFFAQCMKRIKSARDYSVMGTSEGENFPNSEFQKILQEAELRLSYY